MAEMATSQDQKELYTNTAANVYNQWQASIQRDLAKKEARLKRKLETEAANLHKLKYY